MGVGLTTTYAIMHVTIKDESSNPVHGEVYTIQTFVIKFTRDLRQASGFLMRSPVSSTNKTDRHDLTEILLKVGSNTLALTLLSNYKCSHFYERENKESLKIPKG